MNAEIILGFVRHLLTIVGGLLVAKGSLSSGVMDAVIGGVLAVAGTVWSAVQKVQQAQAEEKALKTPVPQTTPGPANTTQSPGLASRLGLVLAIGLVFSALPALAAEPNTKGQIGRPYAQPADEVVGHFYGYTFLQTEALDAEDWSGGVGVGYQARVSGLWVVGIEADAARRFSDLHCATEFDNWVFTLRGKAGYLVTTNLLVYGTGGAGWIEGDVGFVWGGGAQLALTERWSLRAEVLRFETDDSPTVGRVGLNFKF
jgi:opacity protein-like surface antigen